MDLSTIKSETVWNEAAESINDNFNKVGTEIDRLEGLVSSGSEGRGSGTVTDLTPATKDNLGGIKIGYEENNKNYPIKLDINNRAYVTVPWTESEGSGRGLIEIPIATENTIGGITSTAKSVEGEDFSVNVDSITGKATITIPTVNETTDGLMSHEDKIKLDGIVITNSVILTQEQYNSLENKDENTIYYIKG